MVHIDVPEVDLAGVSPERIASAEELGGQLTRFVRVIARLKAQLHSVQEDGLETAAFALLACLVHAGPRRTTALADYVHADISTVSRQVSALVKHGLVERRQDPDDGRACLLAATDEGERMFQRARKRRDAHMAKMLDGWPIGDVRQLTTLLSRLSDQFESYPDPFGTAGRRHDHEGSNVK